MDEATKDQWVRFESGGNANGSKKEKKEDLLYVYTGTVGMMSRYVSGSLHFFPYKLAS